ncbi:MAG: FAD-dependent oxidoreductase [Alphaproteobacteria bacterium]
MGKTVIVIGAGAVGIGAACHLQRDGHSVTVIDRLPPARGCSFGNAGAISATSMMPLAFPGVAWKIPGWLLDPLGPLALRWRHLPALLPWLKDFLAAGRPERFKSIVAAKAALGAKTYEGWAPLIEEARLDSLVRHAGVIHVYPNEAARAEDDLSWRIRREYGFSYDVLPGEELRQMLPDLSRDYTCGVFEDHWRHVLDPHDFVTTLADHFRARGGTILAEEVRDFELGDGGVKRVVTDRAWHAADEFVIAAGAWSHRLAKKLGSNVPLESQRGYHVTMPKHGLDIRHMIMDPTGKMNITPMSRGLRASGTSEFSGVDAPPDFRRARVLITKTTKIFPKLDSEGFTEWAGDRPVLPDTMPVIGRSPIHRNAVYAFGHSQVGLSLGGITGRLVAEVVDGRMPSIDLTPYRVDRF